MVVGDFDCCAPRFRSAKVSCDSGRVDKTNPTVTWPERPTCHDDDWQADRFGLASYREPVRPDQVDIGHGWWSRRCCSYCGSIAPEDLYLLLSADGPRPRLTGADWKYGWPHKFYVEQIPLPAGWEGQRTPLSYTFVNGVRTDVQWRDVVDDRGKFYNQHLRDLEPAAFALLAPLLFDATGIRFDVEDGRLRYAAPYAGFQA